MCAYQQPPGFCITLPGLDSAAFAYFERAALCPSAIAVRRTRSAWTGPIRSGRGRNASGESEGQEAGAQQHEACRGQRQESAGNCILVAHDSPATSQCWAELIKSFGTGFLNVQSQSLAGKTSSAGTIAIEGVREENSRADQTHHCCHCLDHAILPSHPADDQTTAALHSQKDSKGTKEFGRR